MKGLHDQSFQQLLFGFFTAINFPSFLHRIMFEMFTEIAFQSKQTAAVHITFILA